MADYIERTKAISKVKRRKFSGKTLAGHELSFNDGVFETITVLESIPAADVRPERHGKWVYHHDIHGISYSCSNCTCGVSDTGTENYCHYCGAKMDGKDGNGNEKTD